MTFVYLAIVLVLAIFVGHFAGRWLERRRRKAFERLAQELGLRYVARDDSVGKEYRFLDALRWVKTAFAFNVLQGSYKGYQVRVFDYHWQARPGESKERGPQGMRNSFSFFLLEQETSFPELLIYPRECYFDIGTDIGQMLKLPKVDFESVEFSKAFFVRSADRKFAYDVCHPRMMEYLLEHGDLSIEIEGPCIAMTVGSQPGRRRRLKPAEIPERLNQLVEIRELLPDYLYQA